MSSEDREMEILRAKAWGFEYFASALYRALGDSQDFERFMLNPVVKEFLRGGRTLEQLADQIRDLDAVRNALANSGLRRQKVDEL